MNGTQEPGRAGAMLGHSAAARDERTQRRVAVAAMLAAHVPVREMAKQLGCGKSSIDRDVKVIRRYWRARAGQHYDAHVAEDVGTLDELKRAFMPLARGGDDKAALVVLRVLDRRARLFGLDKPTRTEAKVTVEHTTELDSEIERLMELMPRGSDVPVDG